MKAETNKLPSNDVESSALIGKSRSEQSIEFYAHLRKIGVRFSAGGQVISND